MEKGSWRLRLGVAGVEHLAGVEEPAERIEAKAAISNVLQKCLFFGQRLSK